MLTIKEEEETTKTTKTTKTKDGAPIKKTKDEVPAKTTTTTTTTKDGVPTKTTTKEEEMPTKTTKTKVVAPIKKTTKDEVRAKTMPDNTGLTTKQKAFFILLDSSLILATGAYYYWANKTGLKCILHIFDNIIDTIERPTKKRK